MVALYVTQISGSDLKKLNSSVPITLFPGYQESDGLQIHEAPTHNHTAVPAKLWDTVFFLTTSLLTHVWLVPSKCLTGIIHEVAGMFTS